MGQVGSIAAASAGAGAIAAVLARKHGIKARVLEAHASIARGMRDGPDQELLRGTRGLRVAYLVVYPVKCVHLASNRALLIFDSSIRSFGPHAGPARASA